MLKFHRSAKPANNFGTSDIQKTADDLYRKTSLSATAGTFLSSLPHTKTSKLAPPLKRDNKVDIAPTTIKKPRLSKPKTKSSKKKKSTNKKKKKNTKKNSNQF